MNFFKWLFSYKKEESSNKIVLENDSLQWYFFSEYAILQLENEQGWMVELVLWLDENCTKGFSIPLEMYFKQPIEAVLYLQAIGPIFIGLSPRVTIFDKESNVIAEIDLSQPLSQTMPMTANTEFPTPTNEGSYNLQ